MRERDALRIRIVPRGESGGERDVAALGPGERMGLMWQLARDAWTSSEPMPWRSTAFPGIDGHE